MGPDSFRVLTTCSWEQSDNMVKVYVPLRGVQTDMLRFNFTPNSVEVRASVGDLLLSEQCDPPLHNFRAQAKVVFHSPIFVSYVQRLAECVAS